MKKCVMMGFLIQIVVMISFALVGVLVKDPNTFIIMNMIFSFCQAFGSSCIVLTCFSSVPILFQEDKTSKIACIESSSILGLMIGPPIGSYVFGYTNYQMTFCFFASVSFLLLLLTSCFLPENLDK